MRFFNYFAASLSAIAASRVVASTSQRCTINYDATEDHHIGVACPNSTHVRFIGVADWGEEFEAPYVLAVRDGVLKEAASGTYDFILAAGDNIYPNGVSSTTDPLWDSIWRTRWHIGTDLQLPWMAVLGNHDYYGSPDAQVDFHDSNQPGSEYWYMPSTRYSLDITVSNNKLFKITTVDTVKLGSKDFKWLTKEFTNSDAEFVLAMGHYHIYSIDDDGDTGDDDMKTLNKLIQSSPKVKSYLSGHEHDMQFFTASNCDYFVFGGGGRTIDTQKKFPNTKAKTKYFSRNYGFATFDVDVAEHTMDVTYYVYSANGTLIDQPSFARHY